MLLALDGASLVSLAGAFSDKLTSDTSGLGLVGSERDSATYNAHQHIQANIRKSKSAITNDGSPKGPISYNPARRPVRSPPVGSGAKRQPAFILVHSELHRRPLVRMIMTTFHLKIPTVQRTVKSTIF